MPITFPDLRLSTHMQIYSFTHYRDFLAKQAEPWGEISQHGQRVGTGAELLSPATKVNTLIPEGDFEKDCRSVAIDWTKPEGKSEPSPGSRFGTDSDRDFGISKTGSLAE